MTTEKRRFEHKNRLMSKKTSELLTQNLSFPPYVRRFWVPTFPKTQIGTFSLQFLLDVKSPTKIRQHVKAASVWRDMQETCKMCMLMVVMCVFFLGGFSRWSQLLLTSSVSRRRTPVLVENSCCCWSCFYINININVNKAENLQWSTECGDFSSFLWFFFVAPTGNDRF